MATKKETKPVAQEEVPPIGDAAPAAEPQKEEPAKPTAIAKAQPQSDVVDRVRECLESLETFNNVSLPMIRFKEGFAMSEGADDVETFEGVIIYTKEMNVFYKDRFKAGEKRQPDCLSPDGKTPIARHDKEGNIIAPIAKSCAVCPNNVFGSAKEGGGKACKNVRPLFVLVKNQETGEFAVIPKMLRVPPTSLVLAKSFIMNLAADFGAYFAVSTKFSVFKRDEAQGHYNIGFSIAKRLSNQERADVTFIRNGWVDRLKAVEEVEDVGEEHVASAPAAAPARPAGAPRF
jgi:hypothetical protein